MTFNPINKILAILIVAMAMASTLTATPAEAATNNSSSDVVRVYNPIIDGDSVHNDVSAWWPWGASTAPAQHHIVYSNWGYGNDWAIDIFARAEGKRFVTPFASRTAGGDPVVSTVVRVRPGCASGRVADGGYRVTVEAKNGRTGTVLGRADLMHVNRPQVSVGQRLGPWTTIGYTARFRYNSCYQVSSNNGIHAHVEFINRRRYACWKPYSYNTALTELSVLGKVGVNYSGRRARC